MQNDTFETVEEFNDLDTHQQKMENRRQQRMSRYPDARNFNSGIRSYNLDTLSKHAQVLENPLQTLAVQKRNPSFSFCNKNSRSLKKNVPIQTVYINYEQENKKKLQIRFPRKPRETMFNTTNSSKAGPGSYSIPSSIGNVPSYVKV